MESKPQNEVRPIANLKDLIQQSQNLFGNKNAFLLKSNDDNYYGVKYNEFKEDIDAFGTALLNLGLKDKYIAVIGENRYEWCVTYLSVVCGVGIIVPLDKELPYTELENLLIRSNANAIVFSGKYSREMRKLASTLPTVKYFINMDDLEGEQHFLSYRNLVQAGRQFINSGDRTYIEAEIDNNKMSILLFTSGTTDLAKGVMLSHKNICSNVMAVSASLYIDSTDSVLSILPIHHTYECTAGFLVMIYNGCTVSFNEGLKHIAKNLKEVRPTILMLVPLILESMHKKVWDQVNKKLSTKIKLKLGIAVSDFLLKTLKIDIRKKLFKQIHDNIGGRIRLIISGAAALDPNVSKGFDSLGIKVRQGYGLTEFSPIVTVNRDNFYKDDSIGLPLPGVEVKLVNMDSEGIGELIVKGDCVMLGYYENTLATEKILKDGWLYTGDIGYMDKYGFFYLTGRKKNVIVTKNGKNIFPEEVETYLNKSSFILESLVFGIYDEESGETFVEAQIVPDLEAIKLKLRVDDVPTDEINKIISAEVKNINRFMPLYKRVRHFQIREEEFAKTTTKKIKRYAQKTG